MVTNEVMKDNETCRYNNIVWVTYYLAISHYATVSNNRNYISSKMMATSKKVNLKVIVFSFRQNKFPSLISQST